MEHNKKKKPQHSETIIEKMLKTDQGDVKNKNVIEYLKDVQRISALKHERKRFGFGGNPSKKLNGFSGIKYQFPLSPASTLLSTKVFDTRTSLCSIQLPHYSNFEPPFARVQTAPQGKKRRKISITICSAGKLETDSQESERITAKKSYRMQSIQKTAETNYSSPSKTQARFSLGSNADTRVSTSPSFSAKHTKEWLVKRNHVRNILRQLWECVANILKSESSATEVHNRIDPNIGTEITKLIFPRTIPLLYYDSPVLSIKNFTKPDDFAAVLGNFQTNSLAVAIGVAICYFQTGKYEAAIEKIEEVLKNHKDNSYALYNLAVFYLKLHEWEQCNSACSKCLEVVPTQRTAFVPTLYQMRCICNFQMGRLLLASEDYLAATKLSNLQNLSEKFKLPAATCSDTKVLLANVGLDKDLVLDSLSSGIAPEEDENFSVHTFSPCHRLSELSNCYKKKRKCKILPSSVSHTLIKANGYCGKYTIRPQTVKLKSKEKVAEVAKRELVKEEPVTPIKTPTLDKPVAISKRPTTAVPQTTFNEDDIIDMVVSKGEAPILPASILNRSKAASKRALDKYQHIKAKVDEIQNEFDEMKNQRINCKLEREATLNADGISKLKALIGSVFLPLQPFSRLILQNQKNWMKLRGTYFS
eukprot:TRINITY_DN106005_c1_g1_i1.p1 TRINITY_DN106005_c1_g1~~TRINITY_DN106005_c1_g1_i1.p1  ORF type:complete len:663 (-),score=49.38 TRINITY_DN106005_c1_g1_i1:1221-3155(-)